MCMVRCVCVVCTCVQCVRGVRLCARVCSMCLCMRLECDVCRCVMCHCVWTTSQRARHIDQFVAGFIFDHVWQANYSLLATVSTSHSLLIDFTVQTHTQFAWTWIFATSMRWYVRSCWPCTHKLSLCQDFFHETKNQSLRLSCAMCCLALNSFHFARPRAPFTTADMSSIDLCSSRVNLRHDGQLCRCP